MWPLWYVITFMDVHVTILYSKSKYGQIIVELEWNEADPFQNWHLGKENSFWRFWSQNLAFMELGLTDPGNVFWKASIWDSLCFPLSVIGVIGLSCLHIPGEWSPLPWYCPFSFVRGSSSSSGFFLLL